MPKVENDYSTNFDFHIVRADTHGVFPSPLLEKKEKKYRLQPGAHLQNLCRFFFAYIAKQIENKRQKSKNYIAQSRTMPEDGREKTPHLPKVAQFLKGGKNGHFAKAIAKQNGPNWSILGLISFKMPKTYRNYPLKSLELFYAETVQ